LVVFDSYETVPFPVADPKNDRPRRLLPGFFLHRHRLDTHRDNGGRPVVLDLFRRI
jgi:hypothetical protein